jgi:D-alanyl-D-alanine dipeptidase
MWPIAVASQPQNPNAQLISEIVPFDKEASAYFSLQGKHNPIISDVEYAKPEIAVDDANYTGQNPGLPDRPFGKIYREDAKIWAHKDLAIISFRAAEILHTEKGWNLKVMDCLRTIEGQEGMQSVVKQNNWPEAYVSSPGSGAHPRAMAIDLVPVDATTGKEIDMGSAFDHFGDKSGRNSPDLTETQKQNRDALNVAMLRAAGELGIVQDLELLASEWWDFRFKKQRWSQHPALSDLDLPNEMRMTDRHYSRDSKIHVVD